MQKVCDLFQLAHGLAGRHEVIQRGQRMGLTAAELRHQRHHGRGVRRLPRQTSQYHSGLLPQRARKADAGEERLGIAVVGGRRAADNLLQGNCELVRVERTAFADLIARERDLVPGVKRHRLGVSLTPLIMPSAKLYSASSDSTRVNQTSNRGHCARIASTPIFPANTAP